MSTYLKMATAKAETNRNQLLFAVNQKKGKKKRKKLKENFFFDTNIDMLYMHKFTYNN